MKKTVGLLLFVLLASLASGCSSKYMQPADAALAEAQPGPDQAKIVFFRSSVLGSAIQTFLCEEKEGRLEYVAIISYGTKVAHTTTPGKHMYLTGAENGELLEATLKGGKTYYTYVAPRMGWWKARFVFEPVAGDKLQADGFKKDLAGCEWREPNAEGQAWFTANEPSLKAKYMDALSDYMNNAGDRKILKSEDGAAVPAH